ncbi:hypothetical protein [Bordetella petrii]|uniref:hypothetical protein n=1 Tax=Bordetella petrii TaxID=94624 RepID=UPI001A96D712|nr:hypothetical protein [Bordetella petrii]MBO1111832.1 hypothetical protein [Bordetella petrii]
MFVKNKAIHCSVAIGMLFLSNPSHADEPTFEVERLYRPDPIFNTPIPSLRITALTNDLQVEDLIVNRGNCHAVVDQHGSIKGLPALLQYGQSVEIFISIKEGLCSIREAEIETSEGSYVFTFGR